MNRSRLATPPAAVRPFTMANVFRPSAALRYQGFAPYFRPDPIFKATAAFPGVPSYPLAVNATGGPIALLSGSGEALAFIPAGAVVTLLSPGTFTQTTKSVTGHTYKSTMRHVAAYGVTGYVDARFLMFTP